MNDVCTTVGDVLRQGMPVVRPDAPVSDAVRVMQERDASGVIVTEGDRVLGIFTERDFLNRVAGDGRCPGSTKVDEVMTRDPDVLEPGDCVSYAINRMGTGRIRNVPIVDPTGRPIGCLHVRDVLGHLSELLESFAPAQAAVADPWVDLGGG